MDAKASPNFLQYSLILPSILYVNCDQNVFTEVNMQRQGKIAAWEEKKQKRNSRVLWIKDAESHRYSCRQPQQRITARRMQREEPLHKARENVHVSSAEAPNPRLDLLVYQALLARYSLGMRAALEYSAHQADWPYLRMRFQMKQSKIKRNFQIIYLT